MLRLPDGLEEVGDWWFENSDIEKLVIPSCVRRLGASTFSDCEKLCEIVFEPGSRLESIGGSCFNDCGLTQIVIPRSVRSIGQMAFYDCY